MTRTFSTAEAAEQIGAPSERWLIAQLRAGRFPGRKVGRQWRHTEQDVNDTLEVCLNDHRSISTGAERSGLTPRSRIRLAAG
jgi:hypothetical protein